VVHAWHYPAGAWSLAALGDRTHATEALESALTEPARERGEALVADERAAGRAVEFHLLQGQPADVITELAASEHADLVAVGTHGRRGVRRLVLGSVAAAIVRHAPCSVLVVRDPDKAAEPAEPPPAADGPIAIEL
jgi:nucleotide-binding universal stress UspA family protein